MFLLFQICSCDHLVPSIDLGMLSFQICCLQLVDSPHFASFVCQLKLKISSFILEQF